MDRTVCLSVAVCLLVALAGCAGGPTRQDSEEPTPRPASTATPVSTTPTAPTATPTESTPEDTASSVLDSLSVDSLERVTVTVNQTTMAQHYEFHGAVSLQENRLTGTETFYNSSGKQETVDVRAPLSTDWTQQVVGNLTDERSNSYPRNQSIAMITDYWEETTVTLTFETATVTIRTNQSTKLIANDSQGSVLVVTATDDNGHVRYFTTDSTLQNALFQLRNVTILDKNCCGTLP